MTTTYRTVGCPVDEAAAFVAALSRFLASPTGSDLAHGPEAVEVRAHVERDWVTIYLSEPAYAAAVGAFSPMPFTTPISIEVLPRGTHLIYRGPNIAPWGLDEARRRLTQGNK